MKEGGCFGINLYSRCLLKLFKMSLKQALSQESIRRLQKAVSELEVLMQMVRCRVNACEGTRGEAGLIGPGEPSVIHAALAKSLPVQQEALRSAL